MKDGQVNPLGLDSRPGLDETPLDEVLSRGSNSYSSETNSSDDLLPHRRRRREQEMIVRPEAYTDKEGRKHQVVYMVSK